MRQPSPSRAAAVVIEARSEPASGSLKPWHQMTSPAAIGGRWRARWDSVPWRMIVGPTQLTPMYWAPRGSWWAHISSRTAVCSHTDASRPPNSSGHAGHSSPVAASVRQNRCATSRSAGSSVNAPR